MQKGRSFTLRHWPAVLKKIVIGAYRDLTVNFLIAGTQKGGTSALTFYLRQHPQICMAQQKEVHFFDRETFWPIRRINYFFYHSYFHPHAGQKIFGESTPIYMYWQSSAQRIWEYNSAMKFIVILRNPIERSYSQWNMERMNKNEHLPFGDAIRLEPERREEAKPLQPRVYSYVDRGFYAKQLKRILQFFPRNQLLALKNEQLRNEPSEALGAVSEFLDVEMFGSIQAREVHSRPYTAAMSDTDKEYLREIYQQDIRELESLLAWDCSDWLK